VDWSKVTRLCNKRGWNSEAVKDLAQLKCSGFTDDLFMTFLKKEEDVISWRDRWL